MVQAQSLPPRSLITAEIPSVHNASAIMAPRRQTSSSFVSFMRISPTKGIRQVKRSASAAAAIKGKAGKPISLELNEPVPPSVFESSNEQQLRLGSTAVGLQDPSRPLCGPATGVNTDGFPEDLSLHRVNSDSSGIRMSFSNIASLFVKIRRAQKRSRANAKANCKDHHIESSSGSLPLSHPDLSPSGIVERKYGALMGLEDLFVCVGAVDAAKLLRASRVKLLKEAEVLARNILVDESWSCTICGPKHRSDGSFRVTIRYSVCAARSSLNDPHKPVALDQVRNVPGLMTILSRETVKLRVGPMFQPG